MHLGHHAWKRLLFITILHCCYLFASENNLNENRLLSFRVSRERRLKVLIIVYIPAYILIIIVTWMIDMYKTNCESWKIRLESRKSNHWTITFYHKVIFVSLNKHNHDNNRFFESIKLMYVKLRPYTSTYKKLKLR